MNPAVAAAHLEYEHERLREIAARMRALLEDRKYTGAHRIAQLEAAIDAWAWELERLAQKDAADAATSAAVVGF